MVKSVNSRTELLARTSHTDEDVFAVSALCRMVATSPSTATKHCKCRQCNWTTGFSFKIPKVRESLMASDTSCEPHGPSMSISRVLTLLVGPGLLRLSEP